MDVDSPTRGPIVTRGTKLQWSHVLMDVDSADARQPPDRRDNGFNGATS